MKFLDWIEAQGGPVSVARLLGGDTPMVKAWTKQVSSPQALTMVELVELGQGAFDFIDIIAATKGVASVRAARARAKATLRGRK